MPALMFGLLPARSATLPANLIGTPAQAVSWTGSSLTCPRTTDSSVVGLPRDGTPAQAVSGAEDGDHLVGVHRAALQVGRVGRRPFQLGHRAGQAEPAQQLVLPTGLHRRERVLAPGLVVAALQRRVQHLVGLVVGMKIVVL